MDALASTPLIRIDIETSASGDGMDVVHDLLDRFWLIAQQALPAIPDRHWRTLFDSSVAEIAANIVRYAYPAPASTNPLRISLRCFPNHVEAILQDRGEPYPAQTAVIRAPDMTDLLESMDCGGGWGLPIAHAASDDISYERSADGFNSWRIDKHLPVEIT